MENLLVELKKKLKHWQSQYFSQGDIGGIDINKLDKEKKPEPSKSKDATPEAEKEESSLQDQDHKLTPTPMAEARTIPKKQTTQGIKDTAVLH
mmetsp:Transcript_42753/g.41104  ORF Transcript_42753/g.41104 Transcript_42753/m.41104 type:complete len:93 (-) Transcript_42753:214-492(-)